jgi:hypothetical protein
MAIHVPFAVGQRVKLRRAYMSVYDSPTRKRHFGFLGLRSEAAPVHISVQAWSTGRIIHVGTKQGEDLLRVKLDDPHPCLAEFGNVLHWRCYDQERLTKDIQLL